MTLCTAFIVREPVTTECAPRHVRHENRLKCDWCDQTYIVEYESSCTDARDVRVVLADAQIAIREEHLSGHRKDKLERPISIQPWPPIMP
jgi:hypothetical protein